MSAHPKEPTAAAPRDAPAEGPAPAVPPPAAPPPAFSRASAPLSRPGPDSRPGLGSPQSSRRRPITDGGSLPLVDPAVYAIAGELGRGGLARILRATDLRLGRQVALKVLLEPARELQRRFVREVAVAARLQHPGIVPVYEAGRFPDGSLFYAMRLVSGEPLGPVLRRAKSLDARLALLPHLIRVAEAIAYAHEQRFIHRDLKPENILVGQLGETVVIDWGFAKNISDKADKDELAASSREDGGAENLTRRGMIIGTPVYMAPEQSRGEEVDARVDVYALGAILYHLLAGRLPYDERHPVRVLKLLNEGPPPPLAQRARGAPRELVAVAARAMERKREDRYPSARELCDDLQRYQAGKPVAAYRYSRAERLLRWLTENATVSVASLTALIVLVVVGGVGVRSVLAERDHANRERWEARLAQIDALAAKSAAISAQAEASARADELTLLHARIALDRDPTEALAWLKRLSAEWQRWDAARTVAAEAKLHGVAELLRGHEGDILALAFSADGDRLASGSADKSLRVWDLKGGGVVVLTGPTGDVTGVAFSPNGDEVAASSRDGAVRVWTLSTGAVRALTGHEQGALSVAYAPDGKHLASSGGGGEVRVWDLGAGTSEVFRDHRGAVASVAFAPDGKRLASTGEDGVVRLRDLTASTSREIAHEGAALHAVALSPDGKRVAYAGADGQIRLRDLDGRGARVLSEHQGRVSAVGFSADGRLLISASADRSVRLWDLEAGSSRAFLGGDVASAAALSPDGARIARGGSDRLVRLFSVDPGAPPPEAGLREWLGGATNAVVDPSGKLAAEGVRVILPR